jgi:hypothetical protein
MGVRVDHHEGCFLLVWHAIGIPPGAGVDVVTGLQGSSCSVRCLATSSLRGLESLNS